MTDFRYYAIIDEEGTPRAFYPSDVWADEDRPEEAIEITEEEYRVLTVPGAKYVDGEAISPPEINPEDLPYSDPTRAN